MTDPVWRYPMRHKAIPNQRVFDALTRMKPRLEVDARQPSLFRHEAELPPESFVFSTAHDGEVMQSLAKRVGVSCRSLYQAQRILACGAPLLVDAVARDIVSFWDANLFVQQFSQAEQECALRDLTDQAIYEKLRHLKKRDEQATLLKHRRKRRTYEPPP
jgi:hypothetical protein